MPSRLKNRLLHTILHRWRRGRIVVCYNIIKHMQEQAFDRSMIMPIISRIGYAVAYVGFLVLVMAIVETFYANADPVLWSVSIVLLLVGIPLLMRGPDA